LQVIGEPICDFLLLVNGNLSFISHRSAATARKIFISFDKACATSYHRLNGSSSHVLTATSLSYGKAKNSPPPHRIKTHDLIEIKFGVVNYVGQTTPHAKFHVNLRKGGFSANG